MIRILLVDDDEDILLALKICLKRNDFEVIAISKGSVVINTAMDVQPDIILMDINLGGCDGRQICQNLRFNYHFTIPIILFSAISDYQQTIAEYGANGFIDKPFEMNHLLSALRTYMN